MADKTNKLLIILVSVLIVLLIIAVILFSIVINKTKTDNEPQSKIISSNSNIMEIEEVKDKEKEDDDVLIAILGDSSNIDSSVVVIGGEGNYNEKVNNVVENNLAPYYIKVNVQANTVTIYKKDGNGNYNIPLKAMVCSCGSATPVEGTYSLKKYNNWEWKTLYGGQYGRYATQISGDFLFSSVPYKTKGDITTLNYEQYDKLGTIATIGNIQLTVADAKWIYDNCAPGTQVTFYTSETSSPLNRVETKVISEDVEVRGWDPTDPAENNPWKVYVRPERNPEPEPPTNNNEENNTTQNTNTTNNNTENTNTTQNTNTVENNNTTTNNNVVDNNNTVNNTNTVDNTVQNTTANDNTIDNTIQNDNTVQNNVNTTNTVVENRVLENNKDVTISSEIMDTNNL